MRYGSNFILLSITAIMCGGVAGLVASLKWFFVSFQVSREAVILGICFGLIVGVYGIRKVDQESQRIPEVTEP